MYVQSSPTVYPSSLQRFTPRLNHLGVFFYMLGLASGVDVTPVFGKNQPSLGYERVSPSEYVM